MFIQRLGDLRLVTLICDLPQAVQDYGLFGTRGVPDAFCGTQVCLRFVQQLLCIVIVTQDLAEFCLPDQETSQEPIFCTLLVLSQACGRLRKRSIPFLKTATPFIEETQALYCLDNQLTVGMGDSPLPSGTHILILCFYLCHGNCLARACEIAGTLCQPIEIVGAMARMRCCALLGCRQLYCGVLAQQFVQCVAFPLLNLQQRLIDQDA